MNKRDVPCQSPLKVFLAEKIDEELRLMRKLPAYRLKNMARRPTVLLVLVGAVVAVALGLVSFAVYKTRLYEVLLLVYSASQQMKAGQARIKEIKPEDFPAWISRSEKLIAEHARGGATVELLEKEIPSDLAALGVLRVDIDARSVRYVWLGGMDHTNLLVERAGPEGFRVVAHYNDVAPPEILWPRPSGGL